MNRVLLNILIFSLTMWILTSLFLRYSNRALSEDEIVKMFEPVTSKYGIEIVYKVGKEYLSPLIDPGIPVGPSRGSMVVPIEHRILARYPYILQKALERYPIEVIKKYLNAIYFAKKITTEDGVRCGGSYDQFRKIIYLVNDGTQSDDYSLAVFHHEFSSLLLSRHSFFLNPWFEKNPKKFKYLYDSNVTLDLLQKSGKDLTKGTDEDHEKGFMNTYGQTNFENDFNEYAAMIFTYPETFKKIMNQYPRVRAKFLIWLDFYHKIDPVFTEAYLLGRG